MRWIRRRSKARGLTYHLGFQPEGWPRLRLGTVWKAAKSWRYHWDIGGDWGGGIMNSLSSAKSKLQKHWTPEALRRARKAR